LLGMKIKEGKIVVKKNPKFRIGIWDF